MNITMHSMMMMQLKVRHLINGPNPMVHHNLYDLILDSDSDDTLVTASVFNSPTQSLQDISIPVAPYEKLSFHESYKSALAEGVAMAKEHCKTTSSSDDEEDEDDASDDTLVDGVSIASSCTFVSEGGDGYKCAKGEFFFSRDNDDDGHCVDDLVRVDNDDEMPEFIVTGR